MADATANIVVVVLLLFSTLLQKKKRTKKVLLFLKNFKAKLKIMRICCCCCYYCCFIYFCNFIKYGMYMSMCSKEVTHSVNVNTWVRSINEIYKQQQRVTKTKLYHNKNNVK